MLRLAAALHSRGLAVTILHPETRAPDRRKLPADYRLVTIPDNIPPELAASEDIASFVFALNKNCAAPFRDYLAGALREEEEGEDGRLAFVVADVDWFAPLSVARELGVAALALMTTSAARFLVYLAYPSLCQKGYLPVQESNLNTAVQELPPFVVRDLDCVKDMAGHLPPRSPELPGAPLPIRRSAASSRVRSSRIRPSPPPRRPRRPACGILFRLPVASRESRAMACSYFDAVGHQAIKSLSP
ncbi:hypothetical protein ZWY2020_000822 [Hordeum vulgare]|nr:hypothetical protein ZWY2020_000822 [Hordeum vulgare]